MNLTLLRVFYASKLKLVYILIAIACAFLTYKSQAIDYTIGLDSSYMWALNYLFVNDFNFLKDIIYPIGPYGFLKHPICISILPLISIVFNFLIRFLFSFLVLINKSEIPILVKILMIIIALSFSMVDSLIIINVLLLLLQFRNNSLNLLLIGGLASLAILIKSSIGIACLGIIFCYFIHAVLISKNFHYKSFLITISGFFILGSILLLNPLSFLTNAANAFRLAFNYGESLALYPDNNWFFLGLSLLFVFSSFYWTKHDSLILSLCFFPIYTMWKHAMVREEYFHASIFFKFLPMLFVVIILYSKRYYFNILFCICAMFFYYQNLKTQDNFYPYRFTWNPFKDINKSILHYSSFVLENQEQSKVSLNDRILPDSVKTIIGNSSVDVFPNDLSYIYANNFNWKPRKTLQSGAFATWLEKEDTEALNADFILFHFNTDDDGFESGNFDNRYLPNDGVTTLLKLNFNYEFVWKGKQILLLKKINKANQLNWIKKSMSQYTLNKWIKVDKNPDELCLWTIDFESRLPDRLLSFLYKGHPYFIDYKLSNGEKISYRLTKENAKTGVWISPFISSLDNSPFFRVDSVRIRSSFNEYVNITQFGIQPESALSGAFLPSTEMLKDSIIFSKVDNLLQELPAKEGISNIIEINTKDLNLDLKDSVMINISGVLATENWNESSLVYTLERDSEISNNKTFQLISAPAKPLKFRRMLKYKLIDNDNQKIKVSLLNIGGFNMKLSELKVNVYKIN